MTGGGFRRTVLTCYAQHTRGIVILPDYRAASPGVKGLSKTDEGVRVRASNIGDSKTYW